MDNDSTNFYLNDSKERLFSIPKNKTCSIIIPLFGFQSGFPMKELTEDIFSSNLKNIFSETNPYYLIFVADDVSSLSEKMMNILMSKKMVGNSLFDVVGKDASYDDYIKRGIERSIESTSSDFIIVISPSVYVSTGTIDKIIDRLNVGDISVCSGFNASSFVSSFSEIDSLRFSPARDYMGINSLLFGFKKEISHEITPDPIFLSRAISDYDLWNQLKSRSQICISSQLIPFYLFGKDFEEIETNQLKENDKEVFTQKWGYIPA
jgi:hypothetical protein